MNSNILKLFAHRKNDTRKCSQKHDHLGGVHKDITEMDSIRNYIKKFEIAKWGQFA